jgi:hypothetical protein
MPTCGQCHFGKMMPQDFKARACYGAPPSPVAFPTKGGITVKMVRPIVTVDEESCAMFKQRSAIEMPKVLDGAVIQGNKS